MSGIPMQDGLALCQRDSSLREADVKVVSCQKATEKKALGAYKVVTDDTVLFPEGGGQPWDTGTLGGVECRAVTREGKTGTIIHHTAGPLEPGTEVRAVVNWERRLDHMQQHTAQHLISAIAEQTWGHTTRSWELGKDVCTVELEIPIEKLPECYLEELQAKVNTAIRSGAKCSGEGVARDELQAVVEKHNGRQAHHKKGLPEGVTSARVQIIDGIDANACCGTHLTSLSQMQGVAITHVTNLRGGSNITFVAGQRLLNAFSRAHSREKSVTALLGTGPAEHAEKVEKMQKDYKELDKKANALQKEVAGILGASLVSTASEGVAYLHRTDGDAKFFQAVGDGIAAQGKAAQAVRLYLLTSGDEKGSGSFYLAGDETLVKEHGPLVAKVARVEG